MAYIITEDNCIMTLCSNCGRKVKVDISTGISNGFESWHEYYCQCCGYTGKFDYQHEHRAYSLDEILEMNKKEKPIQEENSLDRIAGALEDIRDILKRLDIHRR